MIESPNRTYEYADKYPYRVLIDNFSFRAGLVIGLFILTSLDYLRFTGRHESEKRIVREWRRIKTSHSFRQLKRDVLEFMTLRRHPEVLRYTSPWWRDPSLRHQTLAPWTAKSKCSKIKTLTAHRTDMYTERSSSNHRILSSRTWAVWAALVLHRIFFSGLYMLHHKRNL